MPIGIQPKELSKSTNKLRGVKKINDKIFITETLITHKSSGHNDIVKNKIIFDQVNK